MGRMIKAVEVRELVIVDVSEYQIEVHGEIVWNMPEDLDAYLLYLQFNDGEDCRILGLIEATDESRALILGHGLEIVEGLEEEGPFGDGTQGTCERVQTSRGWAVLFNGATGINEGYAND